MDLAPHFKTKLLSFQLIIPFLLQQVTASVLRNLVAYRQCQQRGITADQCCPVAHHHVYGDASKVDAHIDALRPAELVVLLELQQGHHLRCYVVLSCVYMCAWLDLQKKTSKLYFEL